MELKNQDGFALIVNALKLVYHRLREIFHLDTRSLALLRVMLGWATIWDLLNRARDMEAFYTDSGTMPRSLVLSHFTTDYWASLHMFSGSTWGMVVLWIIHGIIAFSMMIGYRSNLSMFLTWFMTCSLQTRNIIVFHSGDNVHRMALLWASLLPIGDCFSVDAALRKDKKPSGSRGLPNPSQYQHVSVACLNFTFQVLIMYWVAHRYKTAPEWGQTGLAGWMALELDFFRRPFGDFMVLFPGFLKLSTLGVWHWQKWGCYFFFSPIFTGPVRMFGMFGFFCMHMVFFLTMRLGLFGWSTIAVVMGLIPGWFWDTVVFPFFWTKKRRDFRLYYKQGCNFCTTLCRLAGTFCLMPGTEILPMPETGEVSSMPSRSAKGHDEVDSGEERTGSSVVMDVMKPRFQWKSDFIVAQDQYGKLHRNWDALVAIADVSVLFWLWKYPLQKAVPLGNEILDVFHDHSALKDHVPKSREPASAHSQEDRIKEVVVNVVFFIVHNSISALLLYMLFCVNSQAAGFKNWNTPPSLHSLTWSMHFPQNWGMFSPRPPDQNWWYNIKGELDDGTLVELFTQGGLHSMEPAPYTGLTYCNDTIRAFKNHRWFKVFEVGINSHRYADTLRLSLGRWICREYNKRHHGNRALYKHDIIFVSERLNMQKLDGSRYAPTSSVLWQHRCYNKPGIDK